MGKHRSGHALIAFCLGMIGATQASATPLSDTVPRPPHDGSRTSLVRPFQLAAISNDIPAMQRLLHQGADINAIQDGCTALGMAAAEGHLKTVKFLIAQGANPNIPCAYPEGYPLDNAAGGGYVEIVRLLLDHGVKVDQEAPVTGGTALTSAAYAGRTAVAKLLLDRGASMKAHDIEEGKTPLIWAAQNGHLDTVRLFLERGEPVNERAKAGETALWEAASGRQNSILALLLAHGAKADLATSDGTTPLIQAAESDDIEGVRLLLKCGADVRSANSKHETVLTVLCRVFYPETNQNYNKHHLALMQILLDAGADPSAQESVHGDTPLVSEAFLGHMEAVQMLLAHGASVNRQRLDGTNALSTAEALHRDAVARILREAGGVLPTAPVNPAK